MSSVISNVDIDIQLEDEEKEALVKSRHIMEDVVADLWNEDLEDSDEYYKAGYARDAIGDFLNAIGVDYSE